MMNMIVKAVILLTIHAVERGSGRLLGLAERVNGALKAWVDRVAERSDLDLSNYTSDWAKGNMMPLEFYLDTQPRVPPEGLAILFE